MTNYEKIKMMSLEEMADFLGFFNVEEEICFFNNKDMGVESGLTRRWHLSNRSRRRWTRCFCRTCATMPGRRCIRRF